MRKFYGNLAKKLGKEPLVPETWYSIPRQLVATQQVYLNKLALFWLLPGRQRNPKVFWRKLREFISGAVSGIESECF